jgi:hypothetical protein
MVIAVQRLLYLKSRHLSVVIVETAPIVTPPPPPPGATSLGFLFLYMGVVLLPFLAGGRVGEKEQF